MRIVMIFAALMLALAAPASADNDVAKAQAIIRSQTDAIDRDDAATAYSFAAPGIQRLFAQPDAFMTMVRKSYAPVYRHKSFEFGEGHAADGRIAQEVHIIDADGVPWDALYTLEEQPDGNLKIIGCVLKAKGQAV